MPLNATSAPAKTGTMIERMDPSLSGPAGRVLVHSRRPLMSRGNLFQDARESGIAKRSKREPFYRNVRAETSCLGLWLDRFFRRDVRGDRVRAMVGDQQERPRLGASQRRRKRAGGPALTHGRKGQPSLGRIEGADKAMEFRR